MTRREVSADLRVQERFIRTPMRRIGGVFQNPDEKKGGVSRPSTVRHQPTFEFRRGSSEPR